MLNRLLELYSSDLKGTISRLLPEKKVWDGELGKNRKAYEPKELKQVVNIFQPLQPASVIA